ncbi:ABC transporter permease [Futiania mangrovi]|uniref:ABC transporter permease subunit n=1 Tax=Futiania mangrovi TaxID=2959716 RepID=A0A9J6PE46_9PROT|nr:ABC transporter permease subunit [Futiania mangrovii]MCP1337685.1 ABC transporter permease subunit [Futiania mangrovii]
MTPRHILIWLSLPAAVFLFLFFVLPLSVLVVESWEGGGAAYGRLVADPVFWKGLQGSLVLGVAAPLFSVLVGLCVALYLARLGEGARTTLLFVISLPLTFSGLIVAYGFILVFGRAGFFTMSVAKLGADPAVVGGFIYSPLGLGFAYSYYLIPRVVMVVLPVVQNFDHAQLAAARSLGAGNLRAYLDILIPQIFPSLLTAFCLTSAVAIGAYGTALALVGTQVNILPLVLYSKISETGSDFPAAAAISVVLMAITCAIIAVAELFGGRDAARAATRRKPA